MTRRVPYIDMTSGKICYICPKCKLVIPRDLYVVQDKCPHCMQILNKTSKAMLRVYLEFDYEMYKRFHKYF